MVGSVKYDRLSTLQGHTAYPHLADNPVHRLLNMLQALTADPLDTGTDHFQPSTVQISSIYFFDALTASLVPMPLAKLAQMAAENVHPVP